MKCVITGCALVRDGAWVAGDLFDIGSHFVFNGNYVEGSDGDGVRWIIGEPHHNKIITPMDYWMRRGVFVIDKTDVIVSLGALKYMASL